MFHKKRKMMSAYNPETHIPVIRCSICNGEQVAGFQEITTGKFRNEYGIRDGQEIKKIY